MELKKLRQKYPRFVFENYSYRISKNNLEILFNFTIEPGIRFKPKVIIENVNRTLLKSDFNELDNLIFHLGLMEIPSYWKATCSPEIEIRAGYLNQKQINWWQDLIINGLGQFFFENKIPFQKPKIISGKKSTIVAFLPKLKKANEKILVPVGGGKDSVVTLELLKKTKKNIQCFSLNPTEAALKIVRIAGCKKPVIVRRIIDSRLLELNRKGFLNGHTPFSAYLAFLSVLVAAIFGQEYIALSNEKSANEGNVKYLGRIINHQWSKSFEFEKMFQKYNRKYLSKEIKYFSFLRRFSELEIAKMFSQHTKYFSAFLSCNEAYKTASGTKKPTKKWCGKCSKCLFVFTILYPFVPKKQLLKIFGKNLFEDKSLLPIMQQLIGERGFKPFECVGTKKESLTAFYLSWRKIKANRELVSKKLPILLKYFEKKVLPKYSNLTKK